MHTRPRHIIEILRKRSKISQVVGILGPRQVGKSTLLQKIWARELGANYVTLDRPEIQDRINSDPENYLRSQTENLSLPLIIDEAQKAPRLFDVIKLLADEKGKRGLFILSGSVDFSARGGIRESLTGRMGLCRLYPFTISELNNRKFVFKWSEKPNKENWAQAKEIELWLERGGMPIFCRLSDATERGLIIEDWLQSICFRDLLQLKGAKFDGVIARRIITLLVNPMLNTKSSIARELDIDSRIVEKHLQGLETLFVIHKIDPHPKSTGQSKYYLLDAGVAAYLTAPLEMRLRILILNEVLAQSEYSGFPRPTIQYFRNRRGSEVDFIIGDQKVKRALIVSKEASPRSKEINALEMVKRTIGTQNAEILAPIYQQMEIRKGISVVPIASRV